MLDRCTISLHYGRAGRRASWLGRRIVQCAATIALALMASLTGAAQYPGQIKKDQDKQTPSLRAVAILEWTGDLAKPKTSRLVPLTIYDGEQLQDASVYLARPQPLALSYDVEYILQRNGKKIGLFDLKNAGQQDGSWVGFGTWKPMPRPKAPAPVMAKIDEEDDANSDRPVLHRKHGSGSDSSGRDSGAQAPAPDPDRPTLHKKTSDDSSSDTSASSGSAPDPDRPKLHKAPGAAQPASGQAGEQSSGTDTTASDPDRPQLKRGKAKQETEEGYVSSVPGATDPDRPRLARGKSSDAGPEVTPTLSGMPEDMDQAVAVSDTRNIPDHPWSYSWANPADEGKMKSALEDIARSALGLEPKPAAAPAIKRTAAKAKAKPAAPAEPPALAGEQFRVFELAYGAGATLVLSAHTEGPLAEQRFVTLIAQPDLYGSVVVLFKNVTDGAHLDDKPRMRLIDAVDALGDNRGELVFELRGKTQRQFALYRVLRGTATELFVTGGSGSSPGALD